MEVVVALDRAGERVDLPQACLFLEIPPALQPQRGRDADDGEQDEGDDGQRAQGSLRFVPAASVTCVPEARR